MWRGWERVGKQTVISCRREREEEEEGDSDDDE